MKCALCEHEQVDGSECDFCGHPLPDPFALDPDLDADVAPVSAKVTPPERTRCRQCGTLGLPHTRCGQCGARIGIAQP